MRMIPMVLAGGILCASAPSAWAQTKGDSSVLPPPSTSTPDVVLLNDGGMLQGTIGEKTPGNVTIVTVAGERRTIALDHVRYAGPNSDRPRPNPPSAPSPTASPADGGRPSASARAGSARKQLTPTVPDVTLPADSGSGQGSCVGFSACEGTLPTETHRLALSYKRRPVGPDGSIRIASDTKSEGKNIFGTGTRVVGLVVLAGAIGVGTYFALSALDRREVCSGGSCTESWEFKRGELHSRMAGVLGGGLIGGTLLATPHDAGINITPVSYSGLLGSRVADLSDAIGMLVPSGGAFYGRF